MGERDKLFTLVDARRLPKAGQIPCRSCVLDPADCGKQYKVLIPNREDTIVMCMIKGVVSEAPSLQIERNGQLSANREVPQDSAAAL